MKINEMLNTTDVMDLMLSAVCVVNESGYFVFVSAAFEGIFGYAPSEVIGTAVIDYVFAEDSDKTRSTVNLLFANQVQPSFENRWVHKSGHIVHVLWSAQWSQEHQVRVAVAHDISARKKVENELKFMANHDPLTKLPNRTLLKETLEIALDNASQTGTKFALLFVDIDGFKAINDTHGHLLGDKVLTVIAKRLINSVRQTDTVGRLSGDEFLILVMDIGGNPEISLLKNKIRQEIEQQMVFNGTTVHVSLSIGVALFPEDATHAESLIHFADKAMYTAKKSIVEKVLV